MMGLSELIDRDGLQEFVEEVVRLSSPTMHIVVSDADGKALAKTWQLPVWCPWSEEGFRIASDSPVMTRCSETNCRFSNLRACFPIELQGNTVGYVLSCSEDDVARGKTEVAAKLLSKDIARRAYSEFESTSLSTELVERYEEINLLYDIGGALGAIFDVNMVCQIAIDKGAHIVSAQKAWVMLFDAESENWQVVAVKGLSQKEVAGFATGAGEGICLVVIKEERPVLIEDVGRLPVDLVSQAHISGSEVSSLLPLMCVPLVAKGKALGIMCMSGKRSQEVFSAGDLKLLSAIGSQAAVSIYNSHLIEGIKDSERVGRDLEIAQRIQMSLLPKEPPAFEGVDLAGRCLPASNVGGDYFDFLPLSDGELAILIADVSGHSVGAALMMAAARSVVRSEILLNHSSSDVLARTNATMYDDLSAAELFITMFYVHYDRKTGVVSFANGGHNLPFIYRGQEAKCVTLKAEGMVLGILEDTTFDQGKTSLCAGDILVLYTDGITEARNREDEQFGEDRLYRIVQQNCGKTAQALLDEVCRQVYQHIDGTAQYDDITLVVMKVTSDPAEGAGQDRQKFTEAEAIL